MTEITRRSIRHDEEGCDGESVLIPLLELVFMEYAEERAQAMRWQDDGGREP